MSKVYDCDEVRLIEGMTVAFGDQEGVITKITEADGDVDSEGANISIDPVVKVKFVSERGTFTIDQFETITFRDSWSVYPYGHDEFMADELKVVPLPDRHNAAPEDRVEAMKGLAVVIASHLDDDELADAQGATYELLQRIEADQYMRRMVEDRADKIVSNTETEER